MKLINRIQSYFASQNHSKRRYLLAYTILFFFITFALYFILFIKGKSLIWINDGYAQHYTSYVYWGRYLRGILKGIFSGSFNIPEWDFALGEGNDVIQTMQFYALGDPFAWLSALCPDRFTHLFYAFAVFLRVYLAGVAFSALVAYIHPEGGRYGRLAGALCYSFSIWSIVNITRHPFFINPMVLFPLMVLGIEKIIREKKPVTFVLTVFLSAISNFYFFYIIVILTAIVIIARLIYLYRKELKKLFTTLLSLFLYALLGTVMAGAILLPTLYAFLSDARMGLSTTLKWLYPGSFYRSLLGNIFGNAWDYWMCIGLAAPAIIAVIYLVSKKKKSFYKWLLIICTVMTVIPAVGQITNGMSYISNRWSWAWGLLAYIILAVSWNELLNLPKPIIRSTAVTLALCGILIVIFPESRIASALVGFGFAAAILVLLFFLKKSRSKRNASCILLAITVLSVTVVRFLWIVPEDQRKVLKDNRAFSSDLHLAKDAVRQAELDGDDSFYRFAETGSVRRWNDHTLYDVSSPGYYWSISNPAISEFLREMEVVDGLDQQHWGIDNKTILMTTGGIRYYSVNNSLEISAPYGFTKAEGEIARSEERYGYTLYRNDSAFPFAYFMTNCISDESWSGLSALQKQEAMMQSVYLKDYTPKEEGSLTLNSKDLEYEIVTRSDKVSIEENRIVVYDEGASVVFSFEGCPNSETSIRFGNLNYRPLEETDDRADSAQVQLEFTTTAWDKYLLTYSTEYFSFYNDRHDFLRDLGYHEEALSSVSVRFSHPGIYTFDSIAVQALPMENYYEQAKAVQANEVKDDLVIDHDHVSCSYNADQDGILCLSIPYSGGWKAYVDDKEVPIYQANVRYMGIELSAGEHEIRLEYKTPYLRIGALCTLAGFIIFIGLIIYRKRRKSS